MYSAGNNVRSFGVRTCSFRRCIAVHSHRALPGEIPHALAVSVDLSFARSPLGILRVRPFHFLFFSVHCLCNNVSTYALACAVATSHVTSSGSH